MNASPDTAARAWELWLKSSQYLCKDDLGNLAPWFACVIYIAGMSLCPSFIKRQRVVETCMPWRVFTGDVQPCSFGSNAATGTHSISVLFGSGREKESRPPFLFLPFSCVPVTHTRASFVTATAGFRTFGICVCTRVGTVPSFARHSKTSNQESYHHPTPSPPSVPQRHHLITAPAPKPTALDCIVVHTQYTLI